MVVAEVVVEILSDEAISLVVATVSSSKISQKLNALSVINLDIMLLSAEVILNALSVKSLGIMLLTVETRKIRWKQICHKPKRRKNQLYC